VPGIKRTNLANKKTKIKKTKNQMEEMEMEKIRNFFKDESGATMVEYGLLVTLIAIAAIAGIILLGNNLLAMFNSVAGNVHG
jgi:pilus assembly protein Flp/PilA